MNDPKSIPQRRSTGIRKVARSLWYTAPGQVEIRQAPLAQPGGGLALVRTLYSGISRGTERLVSQGLVAEGERERMRAPMQEGQFPFPVKYGYCAVGVVEAGPESHRGKTVFCLHPHQDHFLAPVSALTIVPERIPARRATLTANMETALNGLWDSGVGPADRVVVVGAGVLGLLVAYLSAGIPRTDVTVIDVAEARRPIVESLGARFVPASQASTLADVGADIVFHTSVTSAGLDTAIACAGFEGTIVEMSWYGDTDVPVKLGGAFHSQRLKLVSSQVGHVSAGRRPRWDYARRKEAAIRLLDDARLDALVAEEISFDAAPVELPRILAPGAGGLAPVIKYTG